MAKGKAKYYKCKPFNPSKKSTDRRGRPPKLAAAELTPAKGDASPNNECVTVHERTATPEAEQVAPPVVEPTSTPEAEQVTSLAAEQTAALASTVVNGLTPLRVTPRSAKKYKGTATLQKRFAVRPLTPTSKRRKLGSPRKIPPERTPQGSGLDVPANVEFTPTPIRKIRREQAEVENHELIVEYCRPAGLDKNIQNLKHRRIVDISHVITQSRKLEGHECNGGQKGHFSFDREERKGLDSILHFSCGECGAKTNFHTNIGGSSEINAGMAISMLSTGKGHDHFEEIMSCLDVPCPSRFTYKNWEKKTGEAAQRLQEIDMRKAGVKEKQGAIEKENVDEDGIPGICVTADCGWSHRSYGHRFNAKSGCAVIIGKKTKQILYLGIRNKYCYVCSVARNKWKKKQKAKGGSRKTRRRPLKRTEVPKHVCYRNWKGSSPGMEKDMIVEGFCKSEATHGLRYTTLIGDGDSSVMKNLVEKVPYGCDIEKIECVNHLLKNSKKHLFDLQKKIGKKLKGTKPVKRLAQREKAFLSNAKIATIGRTLRRMILQLSQEGADRETIQGVVRNIGDHCIGNHSKCLERFCTKSGTVVKLDLSTDFVFELCNILSQLTRHYRSIAQYETTNLPESFNHLVTKATGAKQVFYGRRASYSWRVLMAALMFTHKQDWRNMLFTELLRKAPSSLMKKVAIKRTRRSIGNARRKLLQREESKFLQEGTPSDTSAGTDESDLDAADGDSNPPAPEASKDYGARCQKLDMPEADMKEEIKRRLELLQVDEKRQKEIEEQTRGQADNPLWFSYKKSRATASDFAKICKITRRKPGEVVIEMVYTQLDTDAMKYGRKNEALALKAFEEETGKKTEQCGLFVYIKHGCLGASPDALVVGEDAIVEIKCPSSVENENLRDVAQNKANFYLKLDEITNELYLNYKEDYMYQIQGQLGVTGRSICYFVVYTGADLHWEAIQFNRPMWEAMETLLLRFVKEHLLPEIIDPRRKRQMPVRHSRDDVANREADLKEKAGCPEPDQSKEKDVAAEGGDKIELHSVVDIRDEGSLDLYDEELGVRPLDPLPDPASPLKIPVSRKISFLKNGRALPPVPLEIRKKISYVQFNFTCPFDSMTYVIVKAIEANESYREKLSTHRGNTLINFCFSLYEGMSEDKLLVERGAMHLKSGIGTKQGNRVHCVCSVSSWASLLQDVPSATRKLLCYETKCNHSQEQNAAWVQPPLHIMPMLQSGSIQAIIKELERPDIDTFCRKCKKNPRLDYLKFGNCHILLLVDTFKDGSLMIENPNFKGTFRIGDLETSIEADNKRYCLSGVVVFSGEAQTEVSEESLKKQAEKFGHYVGYARDRNGQWELYDDFADDVMVDPPIFADVNPHIIMYTLAE